jgi:hypothetical protein
LELDSLIPPYIQDRIRCPPPDGCCIIARSTPVVSFGDVRKARIATLGLNPSRIEFEQNGVELDGASRRFETTRSLGVSALVDAPSDAVAAVFQRCNDYFCGNPYRRWFNRLEPIVNSLKSSYYDGTACHLDLSQWATDPTWNGLPNTTRTRLQRLDGPFLVRQLESERIEVLLLNGAAVVNGFLSVLGGTLDLLTETVVDRKVTTKLWRGRYNGITVIGWSTNLPSSFGVTRKLSTELAYRVAYLVSNL